MDVAPAAGGDGIAQTTRDLLDGARDVALAVGLGPRRRQPAQGPGGAHGGAPGAEVLGGQLAARDAAQIAVHVAGADAPRLPAGIEIAEQLLPRQFLAAAQDPAEPRVLQAHRVVLAALAAEAEPNRRAGDVDVLGA